MKPKFHVLTVLALPLAGSPLALAQAGFTGPVGGDYATASNWSGNAIPGNANNFDSWIGYGGQSNKSAIYQTTTGYTSSGRMIVGLSNGNVGTFTMQGSAGTLTFAGDVINNANYIGVDGGNGTVNANAGTLAFTGAANGGGHLHIGANALASTGNLNIGGGTVNVGNYVTLGSSGGTPPTGSSGTGNVTITSGSLNIGATSTVTDSNKGVLFMKAGTSGGGSATLTVNGGKINLTRFVFGTGGAAKTINLNGGTIQANASSTSFLPTGSTNNVGNNGGTIDTQTNNITIAGAFKAAAGSTTSAITKTGSGVLTLSGTGHTVASVVVNQGQLDLSTSDTFGSNSAATTDLEIKAGTLVTNGSSASVGFNTIRNLALSGGELRATNNSSTGGGILQAYSIKGTVTVSGTTASSITGVAQTNGAINVGGNTAGTATTFNVGDATGNSAADLTVSAKLQNNVNAAANAQVATGIIKSGAGTMVLAGNNTYTGATTVSAGTLLVTGQLGASAVTVDGGAFGGTGTIASSLTLNSGALFQVADLNDSITVTGPVTLYAGFGVDDLRGIDWENTAHGTYTLISGTLSGSTFSQLANNSFATAFDVGFDRKAYFQQGSLQLVVIPEAQTTLLGGIGVLALLRRRRK